MIDAKHRGTEAQRFEGIVNEVVVALSHGGVEAVVTRSFTAFRMTVSALSHEDLDAMGRVGDGHVRGTRQGGW